MNHDLNATALIRRHADQLGAAGDRFLSVSGDSEQAIACHEAAVALYRAIVERRHPDLIQPLAGLAGAYEAGHFYSQAEGTVIEIVGIITASQGDDDQRIPYWFNKLARVRAGQGKLDLALQAANYALVKNEKHFGQASRQVADSYAVRGDIYARKGVLDKAERCLSLARDIYAGTVRPDATELLAVQARLAELSINR